MNIKKLKYALVATIALLAGLSLPLTCEGMGWLVKPTGAVYTPFTNYVTTTQYVTNTVTGATVTNTVIVPQIIDRWQTNYAPNPSIVSGVQTGQSVATSLAPAPYGTILGLVGSALLAGLGLLAKVKSGQLATANQIIGAVVSGVEAAGSSPAKQQIALAAHSAGVGPQLAQIVTAQTASHPGPVTPAKP